MKMFSSFIISNQDTPYLRRSLAAQRYMHYAFVLLMKELLREVVSIPKAYGAYRLSFVCLPELHYAPDSVLLHGSLKVGEIARY